MGAGAGSRMPLSKHDTTNTAVEDIEDAGFQWDTVASSHVFLPAGGLRYLLYLLSSY